ncbi:MAG: ATP-binding cassette domain-containing protein [Oscillospiraceae bacterium]|jgi:ABC-2 type transport system ATP-binding protein|nr:ATP-binding cassette domain-containing protein [Oscillospiraceae bacterium]
MSRSDSAVSVRGVTKTFSQWQRDNSKKNILKNLLKPEKRAITALDGVSFEIAKGEFVAYAGPNGAGKSTTMKLLSGMLLPTAGEISVLGMSPQKQRRAIMKRLGVLFGNRTELWWDHPVIQSFEWKKVVWDIPDDLYRENLAMVTDLLDIGGLLKSFARELSLGQRMRADLAMLLLHSPTLILLDEPTLGLDVMAKRRMIGFLKRLNEQNGTTIVVTSHDMDDLEEMARRILLISRGKIAFDGGFSDLRRELHCVKKAVIHFNDASRKELEYQDTNRLLRQLAQLDNVADVSFTQTSLEEGLANLFAAWNQENTERLPPAPAP